MEIKNKNKNNELLVLINTLLDKGIVTEQELKDKKNQLEKKSK